MAKNRTNGGNDDILSPELDDSPLSVPKVTKPYTQGIDANKIEDAKVLSETPVAESASSSSSSASAAATPTPPPAPEPSAGGGTPPPTSAAGNAGTVADPPPFTFSTPPPQTPGSGAPGSGGPAPASTTSQVPPDLGGMGSKALADMIMDGFSMFVPKVFESYAAISEASVKRSIDKGELSPNTLDNVKKINKANEGKIKLERAHRDFMQKPLEEVLAIYGISAPPHVRLAFAFVIVVGVMWFQAFNLKKDNKQAMEEIKADNRRWRQEQEEQRKREQAQQNTVQVMSGEGSVTELKVNKD